MFHSNDQLISPTFDGAKDFDISLRSSKQVKIVQHGEDILTIPSSVFKQESEFDLYSPFNHGDKQKPIGHLFKVKSLLKT